MDVFEKIGDPGSESMKDNIGEELSGTPYTFVALLMEGSIGGIALLWSTDEYSAATGGPSYDTGMHPSSK